MSADPARDRFGAQRPPSPDDVFARGRYAVDRALQLLRLDRLHHWAGGERGWTLPVTMDAVEYEIDVYLDDDLEPGVLLYSARTLIAALPALDDAVVADSESGWRDAGPAADPRSYAGEVNYLTLHDPATATADYCGTYVNIEWTERFALVEGRWVREASR